MGSLDAWLFSSEDNNYIVYHVGALITPSPPRKLAIDTYIRQAITANSLGLTCNMFI